MNDGRFDALLTWASEIVEGSWQAWKEACEYLDVDPNRAAAGLSALGHAEFDWVSDRFCTAPSTAVFIPRSSGSVIITGARSVGLLERLRTVSEDDEAEFNVYFHEPIPQDQGPATWMIEAEMRDVAAFSIAMGMRFEVESGRRIADMTPRCSLELVAVQSDPDDRYQRRWYDPRDRRLKYRSAAPDGEGLWIVGEFRRNTAFVRRNRRWFRVPNREYGPYVAYPNAGFLRLSRISQALEVDEAAPLPPLLARAVTLQTGRLPESSPSGLRYWNVDEDLAQTVADRLGHPLRFV